VNQNYEDAGCLQRDQRVSCEPEFLDQGAESQMAELPAGRKLERDPSAPQIIRTERAVGYVFALAVEAL
jgi:hypothetical protein